MITKLKDYYKEKSNLIITLLSYIIPVIIFGHWTVYTAVYFPISIILLYYFMKFRATGDKEWSMYIAPTIHGFSIWIFGINPTLSKIDGSILQVSSYLGFLVYLITVVPFVIFSFNYRKQIKENYEKSFHDKKSKERDKKLNSILGINI